MYTGSQCPARPRDLLYETLTDYQEEGAQRTVGQVSVSAFNLFWSKGGSTICQLHSGLGLDRWRLKQVFHPRRIN